MVGHAKSVSHGINLLNYISGESANKKDTDKIYHVEDRFLPEGIDALGIWNKMQERCKLKNNLIRLEFSPAKEYTEHFTMDDWRQLSHDIMEEFDNIELKNKKTGEIYSHKTNIFGSRSTCWLHLESKGGIPHLHLAVCRYDENGVLNNDRNIHLRAQMAAEAVALKRGWKTAREKHTVNVNKVNADIIAILKAMPKWDWNDYVAGLTAKGYQVHVNADKQGIVHGYSVKMGNSSYKASELGKGRNLTMSKIESTWAKLHPSNDEEIQDKPLIPDAERIAKYSQWAPDTTSHEININGDTFKLHLPQEIEQTLNDVIDYRQYRDWDDLQSYAIALFVCLSGGNDVVVGGGGGGSNDRGWSDDDEERERMRNCCHRAFAKFGKQKKSGRSY